MGRKYMEMKNTNAAIQSYKSGCNVSFSAQTSYRGQQKDYRAWYGLGQTYELLKMHHYCLYYFKQVPGAPPVRQPDAGGPGRELREARQAPGRQGMLLEGLLRRRHRGWYRPAATY